MCVTSSERTLFYLHNGVLREYIHSFVKAQDDFIWPMVKDTGIRISLTLFLSLYTILKFMKLLIFIFIIY